MFNHDSLSCYLQTFWGYGPPSAATWFIGKEHGGGNDNAELGRRLEAWHGRGQRPFEDLHEYHEAIGELRWTGPRARIQSTYGSLVRIELAVEGASTTTDSVRTYQAKHFGRNDGNTCVVELLPLPSKDNKEWRYAEWSDLPMLRSRNAYEDLVVGPRQRALRDLLLEHQPAAAVFYGLTFRERFETVVGARFEALTLPGEAGTVGLASLGSTTCVLVPHPTSFGMKRATFTQLGAWLRARRTS